MKLPDEIDPLEFLNEGGHNGVTSSHEFISRCKLDNSDYF